MGWDEFDEKIRNLVLPLLPASESVVAVAARGGPRLTVILAVLEFNPIFVLGIGASGAVLVRTGRSYRSVRREVWRGQRSGLSLHRGWFVDRIVLPGAPAIFVSGRHPRRLVRDAIESSRD